MIEQTNMEVRVKNKEKICCFSYFCKLRSIYSQKKNHYGGDKYAKKMNPTILIDI